MISCFAQVTSLQVQLDEANMELASKDTAMQSLTEQCNALVHSYTTHSLTSLHPHVPLISRNH